ncbi:MAG: methylated-DNA--[protein]-cysteine S-methyltransferase [Armatimonadetes bacterium]|nr:methylated-DNA--[protein]-cysteine S-methyltransferase [Armatimonadota bacterium]
MDETIYMGESSPVMGPAEWPQKRRIRQESARGLVFDTAAGWVGVALDGEDRLIEIVMPRETAEATAEALGVAHPHPLPDPGPVQELIDQLRRYFNGEPTAFRWPFNLSHLTPFQQEALTICASIPHGELRSYGWIADRMGRPQSARPVGQAMGANPIPILIPCHRVVGSDGKLVGYGGGMGWKERLLKLEGALPGVE